MNSQIVYFSGWWIELEYTYTVDEGQYYGPMEDCYPASCYFDYKVLDCGIDDEEDHCPKDILEIALADEDTVYGLLDTEFQEEWDEDYD